MVRRRVAGTPARTDDALRRQHRVHDRRRGNELVCEALARHLAARRLDDRVVCRRMEGISARLGAVGHRRGRLRRGLPCPPDRRASGVHPGKTRVPGKAAAHAAVPPAADGAADHLRHTARDGALQAPARGNDQRRDPRQPDSRGAIRDPGDDAVHRADRSQPRVGGARFRSRNRTDVLDILVPLLGPGILAASLLVLVRTIALFELTFLTAGPDSQTLVVALYYAVFAAGVRAPQSVDAMAMIYMVVTLVWLLIAMRFVNPTQLVSRVREHPQTA